MNRLTWAGDNTLPNTGNGTAWSYDAAGNIAGKENYQSGAGQGSIGFSYDLVNRLWLMGTKTYNNDVVGARIEKTDTDSWSYIYDGESRLTQVTKNGAGILDNTYDGSGMRIKQVSNGRTTYYIYRGNSPIMEYSMDDGKYTYFVYSGNKLIAEEKDGVVKYYHQDHLGSTRLVTDAAGNALASYKFKPYGEVDSHIGDEVRYGFTGKEADIETGLTYFGSRYYDPEIGRFISADPIKAGINWYAYCYDNPVRYTDPLGLDVGWYGEDNCGGNSGYNKGDSRTSFSYTHTDSGYVITQKDEHKVHGWFGTSWWSTDQVTYRGFKSNGNLAYNIGISASGKVNRTFYDNEGGIIPPNSATIGLPGPPVPEIKYYDLNGSYGWLVPIGGVPVPLGVTGGVMKDSFGYHFYFGGGLVSPGAGISFQVGDGLVTNGWNGGLQGSAIVSGQVGINSNGYFTEKGLGVPGGSLTGYYVW